MLCTQDMHRVLHELGLGANCMRAEDPGMDRFLILRYPLMNPFLIDDGNGVGCIDRYFDCLSRRVALLLPAVPAPRAS
jgi:hypothetical protein